MAPIHISATSPKTNFHIVLSSSARAMAAQKSALAAPAIDVAIFHAWGRQTVRVSLQKAHHRLSALETPSNSRKFSVLRVTSVSPKFSLEAISLVFRKSWVPTTPPDSSLVARTCLLVSRKMSALTTPSVSLKAWNGSPGKFRSARQGFTITQSTAVKNEQPTGQDHAGIDQQ